MKVLLVKPVSHKMPIVIPNLGLGYLAAQLKKAGHDVEILDCAKLGWSFEEFGRFLRNKRFDIIGVQIFTCDFSAAKLMLEMAREQNGKIVTVAGGPHVSGLPEDVMRSIPSLDYGFQGEAELGLPRLCDFVSGTAGVKLGDIPGLIYRQQGSVRVNARAIIDDVDSIGLPDWDLINPASYPVAPHGTFTRQLPVAPIITSRGCPYECTYCGVESLTGRRLRKRSPASIIAEIELLVSRFGVREIHIEDDNFTLDRNRVMEFCNLLIERKMGISWACPNGVRLDTLDAEVLRLMEKSGCYSFAIGIESGSPKILKDMHREMSLETMKEKIQLIASETNIRMTGFTIVGYPTESLEDIEKTINFTLDLPLSRVQYSNFLPFPGTKIFNKLLGDGLITLGNMDWDSFQFNRVVYAPPGITPAILRAVMRKGFRKFYFRPKIIFGLLREIHSVEQFRTILKRVSDIFR